MLYDVSDYLSNLFNVHKLRELKDVADSGRVREHVGKEKKEENHKKTPKERQTDIKKVREVVTNIIQHSDIVMAVGKYFGATNIKETLKVIKSEGLEDEVAEEFGIDFYMIRVIFDRGIVKESWINLMHGEFQKDIKEETYVE